MPAVVSSCRGCTAEIASGSTQSTFSWVCDHPRESVWFNRGRRSIYQILRGWFDQFARFAAESR